MRPYRVKRPSRKAVRVTNAFYAGGQPDASDLKVTKTGPQKEGLTNDAIAEWAALHPELMIGRNKRRLATPVGYHKPIMLGWLVEGSADWIGYRSMVITPDLVGRRVAVFVAIEAKRADGGVVSKEQEAFLNAAKDAGAIAGVSRGPEDSEMILVRWRAGL